MPLRKIILAPDSFKETLTAAEAAAAMAEGVRRANPSIIAHECPIGDGGEGTMDAIVVACGGECRNIRVTGPLDEPIIARFGLIDGGRTAVIELAQAAGLSLVPIDRRNPMRTTTFGAGVLIMSAMKLDCECFIVCVGGSATVDGGAGMAQACGWRFIDQRGREIMEHICGGMLESVSDAVPPEYLPERVRVACDVTNPLLGPNGAAAVYSPQKGATPVQVQSLEAGLAHFATIAKGDVDAIGAGASGGAGYGLATLLGARLERGIDLVLNTVDFDARCRDADLVITGEGRLDAQSLQGKACMGVASRAARHGVPTIAIVGSIGPGAEACVRPGGLRSSHSLAERFGEVRAKRDAKSLIADITEEVVRTFNA